MRRYLSTAYKVMKKLAAPIARARQPKLCGLSARVEWAQLISAQNRRQLLSPPTQQLHVQREKGGLARLDAAIVSWLVHGKSPYTYSWTVALNALGAQRAHAAWGDEADLAALLVMLDRHVDGNGNWLTPINKVDYAMKGYSLLYAAERTAAARYLRAADALAEALLNQHPRAADGSLLYERSTGAILVDTLAMVCPFLARYANDRQNDAARDLAVQQLLSFIANNVDGETHLPYHGYYADGPKRLGLHAWGRGVGWYLLGLVETLAELPAEHPASDKLRSALSLAAGSVVAYQRADGHWSWAILHRSDTPDSSTTALVGYSLVRGRSLNLLDASLRTSIDAALEALATATHVDGVVDGGLGECRGLGKYPQVYGPQPWLQGASTAFAASYFEYMREGKA